MTVAVATRRGQYSILEVDLPGRAAEPAGVVLFDPEEGRLDFRLRRDWDEIAEEEDAEVLELLEDDLRVKASEMGPEPFLQHLEEMLSNALRISERDAVLMGDFDATLNRLYNKLVPATILQFETHLPVYSLAAAAGRFGELMQVEEEGWVEAPPDLRLTPDMFVATVTGRSMEPRIADGSRCVFRRSVVGSRENRLVLVENLEEAEEGGQRYTIKRYRSVKHTDSEGWRHGRIIMEPLNPEFDAWEIDPEAGEAEKIRVVGEFVRVLD